ncbi:MAG: polymer-forming cytoskeletal protein, partial [Candidatus Thermoplasmatota archaeon]|nr:polymer-forming cytoskeletal protein [Candidatus Thermoplasmatota archaeon]
MGFSRHALVFPEGTIFEEHSIVTRGDAIIADYCALDFGIITDGRVFAGQKTRMKSINAKNDVRIDMGSVVEGDVYSGNDVFLGERSQITGKLSMEGDLDVGDDVKIEGGFEAKGWINIRNPIPMIVYVFIYLLQLIRAGKSEEVEEILKELEEGGEEAIPVSDIYSYVPHSSVIGLQNSSTPGSLMVGSRSKLLGNWEVSGITSIGSESKLYGTIKSANSVVIGSAAEIFGSIHSDEKVSLDENARICGDIFCKTLKMAQSAVVEGTIKAQLGIKFVTKKTEIMDEAVERFNEGA